MIRSKAIVCTSTEAVLDHVDSATHWTPNTYNYGTYKPMTNKQGKVVDERGYIVGHSERNLQQINAFAVDIDTKGDVAYQILFVAEANGLPLPTYILETDKGYQAFWVLDNPLYITNRKNYLGLESAKRISENIRLALAKDIPAVDMGCNHFGFFRLPSSDNIVYFAPENKVTLKEMQSWSIEQDKEHRRKLFSVLPSYIISPKQINAEWVQQLVNLKHIKGEQGILGRDNALFTVALACYSSDLSKKEAFNVLDEFNSNLSEPLNNRQVKKILASAYKGKYQGASKTYVQLLLESHGESLTAPFSNVGRWYKHKKERKDRVRSHWHEWEADIIAYLNKQQATTKGFYYTTQQEISEAVGVPRRTLNEIFKKSKKIYHHVIGKGRGRKTGLATITMIFSFALSLKESKQKFFLEFVTKLSPSAGRKIVSTLKALRTPEKRKYGEDLTAFDTG